MASIRFTQNQIEQFVRLLNCLEDPNCFKVLEYYAKDVVEDQQMRKILDLWQAANNGTEFDELQDLIDEIDYFNDSPLLSLHQCDLLPYIRDECCKLLMKHHSDFVQYLRRRHMA